MKAAQFGSRLFSAFAMFGVGVACGIYIAHVAGPLARVDGVGTVPLMFLEDTAYAAGYTHDRFTCVGPGLSESAVMAFLGPPLSMRVDWKDGSGVNRLQWLKLDSAGMVIWPLDLSGRHVKTVRSALGSDQNAVWVYSRSPSDTHYRIRRVYLERGTVTKVEKGIYGD